MGTILRASTSVRRDATAPALQDLLTTLSSATHGFTPEEWQKSTNTMRNNIISRYQSRQSMIETMKQKWILKKDINLDRKRLNEITHLGNTAPTDDSDLFAFERGVVIVAGDVKKIKESLAPWTFTSINLDSILEENK